MIGPAVKSLAGNQEDAAGPYRVMVVDDSLVIRAVIAKALEADPAITVVASVANGKTAISTLDRKPVEVVVLDIEMPIMDGLTALPELKRLDPQIQVIMASTLTLRNAEISLRAISLGAVDYVSKPSTAGEINTAESFRGELIKKVKVYGRARRRRAAVPLPRSEEADAAATPASRVAAKPAASGIALREPSAAPPRILAIGSSTGGPQALFTLFEGLRGELPIPALITQHMPPTFTTILAEHISRNSGIPCVEAEDGMAVENGRIHLAPGGYHMTVAKEGGRVVLRLNQDAPENYCRPSVDPMLRSVANVYGRGALTVMLTGMGSDGLKGGKKIIEAGGTIIAQDEASSIVWGMPGAVAQEGLCSAVLALPDIAPFLRRRLAREAA
jgi:two-component system chemotaxis response regulator CheB